jgi:hypothetical protein
MAGKRLERAIFLFVLLSLAGMSVYAIVCQGKLATDG